MTAAGAAIAPASPQPLMPSGLDGHFVVVVPTLNDGKFVGARHRVVHERAGHELALFVIDRVLEQRLADALRHAAVHLALDDHRIDNRAEVVDRGPARLSSTRPVSGSISTSQMWQPAGNVKLVGS